MGYGFKKIASFRVTKFLNYFRKNNFSFRNPVLTRGRVCCMFSLTVCTAFSLITGFIVVAYYRQSCAGNETQKCIFTITVMVILKASQRIGDLRPNRTAKVLCFDSCRQCCVINNENKVIFIKKLFIMTYSYRIVSDDTHR